MLLLVLILILIAFGLLVVALLSGSVLWAWVSVAVSAVAALVLIVDGLQRRAATRAARVAASDPGVGSIDYDPPPEVEAVTEILPVVPPAGAARPDADGEPGLPREGDLDGEPPAGFDRVPFGQRTAAMSTRQPSGSDDGPSGAGPGTLPPTGSSSPSVTAGGVDAPAGVRAGSGGSGSEATVVVARGERGDRDDAPDEASERVPLGKADRDAGVGPADRDAGVRPSDPTMQGVSPADGPSPEEISAERMALGSPDPVQPPTERDLGVVPDAPAVEEPVAADGEPPEEQPDRAAAELVATLPDEVVVIDEQPRYHLSDCRALLAKPVIPLPVREAVELGFTPCGWCTPDTRLAERHPARAQ